MKNRHIVIATFASLLFAGNEALASDHIYVGSMCVQTNGLADLHVFANDHNASNMHGTNNITISCPIVNPDDTAHDVCIEVQVFDAHASERVGCRVTHRTTTSVTNGGIVESVDVDSPTGKGRDDLFISASLPADAAYSLTCTLPDTDPSASNVERYSVTDGETCLI